MDRGAWWATVHGVAKSQTRLSNLACTHAWYLQLFYKCKLTLKFRNFPSCPDSSVGKESACNAGNPGLIPRSGGTSGEGVGYPLQVYSWISLVVQLVKNPPAVRETWV